jgi:hypothetical protein
MYWTKAAEVARLTMSSAMSRALDHRCPGRESVEVQRERERERERERVRESEVERERERE